MSPAPHARESTGFLIPLGLFFLLRRFLRGFLCLFFRVSCFGHMATVCSDMTERADCPIDVQQLGQ
jgi:hypothetical protein